MAYFNQHPSLPRDPTSIERHLRTREGFLPPAWLLLLVVAIVFALFYLAVAARLADTTAVLSTPARPSTASIVIGEETRPTQAPIR